MSDQIDSIISQAVQDASSNETGDGYDDSPDTSGDSEGDAAPEPTIDAASGDEGNPEHTAVTPDAPPAAVEPHDELAKELGIKPGKKGNRIPYERVQKIIQTQREKAAAEAKAAYARYDSPEFQNELRAIELARTNPAAFAQALMNTPEFAQYLRPASTEQQPAQQTAQQQQPQVADQEPAPDVLLTDGSLTYSAQRLAEVMQWREAKLQKSFEERLAPLGEIQRERQVEMKWNSALEQQRSVVADARQNWPGFKDHEHEIRQLLARDERISLEAAYRQVVLPMFKADRDKMRAEILAEMNRKPAAAAGVVPGAAAAATSGKDASIESIIRSAIRYAA